MNVLGIIEKLRVTHKSDMELLFNAILKLQPTKAMGLNFGELSALNDLKKEIILKSIEIVTMAEYAKRVEYEGEVTNSDWGQLMAIQDSFEGQLWDFPLIEYLDRKKEYDRFVGVEVSGEMRLCELVD